VRCADTRAGRSHGDDAIRDAIRDATRDAIHHASPTTRQDRGQQLPVEAQHRHQREAEPALYRRHSLPGAEHPARASQAFSRLHLLSCFDVSGVHQIPQLRIAKQETEAGYPIRPSPRRG
jgi:hypothetical protein